LGYLDLNPQFIMNKRKKKQLNVQKCQTLDVKAKTTKRKWKSIDSISKKIKICKEILLTRFPKKSNEINFLIYLLERRTESFISGDFERCFIDAVTIINDVTVVKSTKQYREKILNKKQWNRFRVTRAALVHSEIEEENEEGKNERRVLSKKEVMEIKSHLYQSCIDIQKVVFEVVSLFCLKKKHN
jgi:hypothetical protein